MRYKSQWGSRQCRGDLFVFKDVFSAQFLNCRRIVKPNADHRKIHLEISVSLSLFPILFRFCFGYCVREQKSMYVGVNRMYFVAIYACGYISILG